jgi:hypothetical protein
VHRQGCLCTAFLLARLVNSCREGFVCLQGRLSVRRAARFGRQAKPPSLFDWQVPPPPPCFSMQVKPPSLLDWHLLLLPPPRAL